MLQFGSKGNQSLLANGEEASANLIQRIVAQTSRGDIAWSAVRDLKAGTRSGGHTGWSRAWIVNFFARS